MVVEKAKARLDSLAKPVESLGRLELIGLQLAKAQNQVPPDTSKAKVIVFAGDHGINIEENVSAFPSSVTVAMVQTIVEGKSSVSALARNANARLELINVGVAHNEIQLSVCDEVDYVEHVVGLGTKNFLKGHAMTEEEMDRAMQAGRDAVRRAVNEKVKLVAVGELGIGNTTAASALAARLLSVSGKVMAGPGTGLDEKGVARKAALIDQALARNGSSPDDPRKCLMDLGGYEIAAMVGCYLECIEQHCAVVVDGFIATSAALVAHRMNPAVDDHFIFATRSAEPGHAKMIDSIGHPHPPLLDWQLRLGEASGAALALPLIQAAGRLFSEVATLEEVMQKL